ncbi:MAG TPA: PrsW family glutamic-type intramembrane protease [Bacteroidales bacterium]|nr:PrsW family glutamic-type intramembrane protease [Bacteroidales bacterium]HPT02992.1 PrsW family glutamic-type intramembrane protease [Bacteroidales bacterium]
MVMLLLILSLAPVAALLAYIYFRDRYEKEPVALILKGFLAGAALMIPCMPVETWLSRFCTGCATIPFALYTGFIVAGTTEELLKFLMIFLLFFRNRNFNERYDGIVYAVSVSLGFAAIENVMYVFNSGIPTGLIRAFTAVPAHAFFGIVMGYYFGLARFVNGYRKSFLLKAFLFPMILHGLYDFILFSQNPWILIGFVPLMIILWRVGLNRIKKLQQASAFNPLSENFLELPAEEEEQQES